MFCFVLLDITFLYKQTIDPPANIDNYKGTKNNVKVKNNCIPQLLDIHFR